MCAHVNTPLGFAPTGPTVSPWPCGVPWGLAPWGQGQDELALLGWDVTGAITLMFCKLLGSAVQLPLTQRPRDTHGHFGWML